MNKLKITGVRGIPFEDTPPEENKDYLISLRVSYDGCYTPAKHGEESISKYFHLKVVNVEQFMEVGKSEPKRIHKGFTPSQEIRLAIVGWLSRRGIEDTEANYEKEARKISEHYNNKE